MVQCELRTPGMYPILWGQESGSNCGEEGLKSCMEKEQCVQRPWGGCEGWKEPLWGGGKVEGGTVCAKALRYKIGNKP